MSLEVPHCACQKKSKPFPLVQDGLGAHRKGCCRFVTVRPPILTGALWPRRRAVSLEESGDNADRDIRHVHVLGAAGDFAQIGVLELGANAQGSAGRVDVRRADAGAIVAGDHGVAVFGHSGD